MTLTMKRHLWKHGRAKLREMRHRWARQRWDWIQEANEGRGPWARSNPRQW